MVVVDFFLDILEAIAGFFNSILEVVNPDPFPEMIQNMQFSADSPFVTAWAWINNFVDVGSMLLIFQSWLTMFVTAWAIMLLLRWIKARS